MLDQIKDRIINEAAMAFMENVMACEDILDLIVCSKNMICQVVNITMPDYHVEYIKNDQIALMPQEMDDTPEELKD